MSGKSLTNRNLDLYYRQNRSANKKIKEAESGEAGQLLHGVHLISDEAAISSDLEVPQFKAPESRAYQMHDPAAHGFDHTPHQTLLAARHGDPEVGQIAAHRHE